MPDTVWVARDQRQDSTETWDRSKYDWKTQKDHEMIPKDILLYSQIGA